MSEGGGGDDTACWWHLRPVHIRDATQETSTFPFLEVRYGLQLLIGVTSKRCAALVHNHVVCTLCPALHCQSPAATLGSTRGPAPASRHGTAGYWAAISLPIFLEHNATSRHNNGNLFPQHPHRPVTCRRRVPPELGASPIDRT